MTSPRRFLRRLRALLTRRAIESTMDAEMRHHIECETSDRIARGQAPDEARRTALADFGGTERYKEEARDQRGFRALEEFAVDARHAFRVLRRHPAYAISAVLTFALGIGLTTAIFSIVHGVLLSPLPYEAPDRLAVVWERHGARGIEDNVTSVPTFEAWRERNRSFTTLVALVPAPTTLGGDAPERLMGADVSPEYFGLLGVHPALGRAFTAEEASINGRVVVLSDALWRRRFAGDSAIVGRSILVNQQPFTVIGVMPAAFDPPKFGWLPDHELWFPFVATADNRTWGRYLLVVGRLRDGVSLDAARRDMEGVAALLARENSALEGWSASVVGLARQITGDVRTPLLVLMGAVGLLLVMAATNVGNLTLGFMRRQERQLALRRAIGATAGRVFRQLLTHSLVLGAIGSAAGFIAAIWGTMLLRALLPPGLPRGASITVDRTVLLFSITVGVVATLAFGIASALRSLSGDTRLLALARTAAGRVSTRAGTGWLVMAEVALGVVLTVSAGLMVRSFVNLRGVPLGFDARSVVTARVSLPGVSYRTPEQQHAFFDAWGDRVRGIPGVRAVGLVNSRPFACCAPVTTVRAPGERTGTEVSSVDVRAVDSAFFPALRIPVLAGAGFGAREPADGPQRVLVNEALARALWPGANPVGREVHVVLSGGITAQVIGVAGDVHLADARTPPRATVYLHTTRFPSSVRDIVVRGDASGESLLASLRSTLQEIDPSLPLYDATRLTDAVNESLAQDRFTTLILSVFSLVSLLLAAVGIYGVLAAEVNARQKEIGVRLALGARASGVLSLVLRRALGLALAGAATGVMIGLVLSRAMSGLVYGVATSDPLAFGAVAVLLLVIAAVATLVPAWRAARIAPVEAIRND